MNAWCFFYSVKWFLHGLHFVNEEAIIHVVMALFVSGVAFTLIFVLDKIRDTIEDHEELGLGDQAVESIEQMIEVFGLLVGFSWEQSFDVALDAITVYFEKSNHIQPAITRGILSIVLVALVFPAWKNWILPQQLELDEKGTIQDRIFWAEKYAKKFTDKATTELDLDKHHLVLKRTRRALIDKDVKAKEDKKKEKEKEREEQCKECGGSGRAGCCRKCEHCGGTGKSEEEEDHTEKKHKKNKKKGVDGRKHFIVTSEGMQQIEPENLHNEYLVTLLLKDANEDGDSDDPGIEALKHQSGKPSKE